MNTKTLFADFTATLSSRRSFLTEDSVRYMFFSCMQKQDKIMDHYVMELPYESLRYPNGYKAHILVPNSLHTSSSGKWRQELDMYYDDALETTMCIEVKFHRKGGLPSSFAHTDAAGRIINDMRRLQLLQPNAGKTITRLFVYVADDDMHNYLNGMGKTSVYRSSLSSFYNRGGTLSVNQSYVPDRFFTQANHSFNPKSSFAITAKKVFFKSIHNPLCPVFLHGNCHVSIYEII